MNPTLAITLPPWGQAIAIAVFVMISLLMIGVILLQRPQGGGLTAAFGGSQGAGQTAFGTKTGDALTIFTCVVFAVYVGASVFLNHAMHPKSATAAVAPAPATTPTTTPATAPATAPTLTPITDPTKLPPTDPAATPGTAPGTTPATTPGTAPATAPGTGPGTNPGTTPPTTPPATNPELPKTPEPAPTTPPGQPK